MTVVAGPRQVGKTTLVRQALADVDVPNLIASADDPAGRGRGWLEGEWQAARVLAAASAGGAILALDEVQKVPAWSEVVKRLWDEDTASGLKLRIVLLGSSPSLMRRGLSDSLTGRLEVIRLGHWSFPEMRDAFGWDLDRFVFFGGYPGAAPLVEDLPRWRSYMRDSLIETTIARDVLLMTRVDKPAVLRQLFRLGADYSGQIVAYQKLVGELQDAGNTTTIAHYLDLLTSAGLLTGLQKYSGSEQRRRASSPKLLMLDTGLMTAMSDIDPQTARADGTYWGRLVETSIGAHLVSSSDTEIHTYWWRDGDREVDFVLADATRVLAIEVTGGRPKRSLPGLSEFGERYPSRKLLIGGQGLPLDVALSTTARNLLLLTA